MLVLASLFMILTKPLSMSENKFGSTVPGKEPIKTETIDQLAHRHLMDEHHTTTDEEIRNATMAPDDVVFDVPGEELSEVDNTTVIPPMPGETDDNDSRDRDDEGDKDVLPNPYTVLGS